MNINDLSTQLLFMTTPIVIQKKDGTTSIGTSFFLKKEHSEKKGLWMMLLVTNRHVIENALSGFFHMFKADEMQNPILGDTIKIILDKQSFSQFVISDDDDIAVLPITGILQQLETANQRVFFRAADSGIFAKVEQINDLAAIEDITFIGYPSGIIDTKSSLPLSRRGITSTPIWADHNGRPEFLIDAGVFPGSSGSPVFILNQGSYASGNTLNIGTRILLVGMIFQTIQTGDKAYLGLGKVIKIGQIIKLLREFDN